MKKIGLLLLVILTLQFSACNQKTTENNQQQDSIGYHFNDTLKILTEAPEISAYKSFLNNLDSTDMNTVTEATNQFKTVFTNKRPGLCDSAFVLYQSYLDTVETKLNEQIMNDTTDYSVLYSGETVPKRILDFQSRLQKNGFKIISEEGMAYIEQNRDFVFGQLSDMVSPAMKNYMQEIAIENKEGFSSDAAITISPQKHVDRIIWYENFIKDNPGFALLDNCKNYKKAYLTYLITGFDNTPLFEYSSDMILTPYYTKAWNYLIKKYPDSEAASLINPYYTAAKQKQENVMKDLKKQYVIKGLIYDFQ
ncbi:MAG: hypothetical protein PHH37_15445 [Paludibacter sp.]|nr:hypothetical protein [Paludibacter sp.]